MSVNCPDCQRLYNTHKAHDQVHKSKMIHAEQEIAALKEQAKGCCGDLLVTYGPDVIAEAERQAKIAVLEEMRELHVAGLGCEYTAGLDIAIEDVDAKIKQLEADQ
tara:strand:+ start:595 stop:912 length:318 start_codon:yes stop_codon:yes gene_type:complete